MATMTATATDFYATDREEIEMELAANGIGSSDDADAEPAAGLVIDTFRFDATIHNGYITIHNTNTGNHRTLRIETVKGGALDGKRIVSLLIGPDREDDAAWRGFASAGAMRRPPCAMC
mgnify:CR=1 FL=1